MEFTNKTYELTKEACDMIADDIMVFCEAQKISRKNALRYRLSAEECLLYWLENGFDGHKVNLKMGYSADVSDITAGGGRQTL